MITDFRIIENTLVRLDPVLIQYLRGEWVVVIDLAQRLQRLLYGAEIIFRQVLGVGTWISQYLMPLIQRLRQPECVFGREAETRVRFTLQTREVEQCRRH